MIGYLMIGYRCNINTITKIYKYKHLYALSLLQKYINNKYKS